MKINKQSKYPKPLYTIAISIMLIAVLGVIIWWSFGFNSDDDGINYSPPTTEQQDAGDQTAEQTERNEPIDPADTQTDELGPEQPQNTDTGSINITVATQHEDSLSVRTLIHGGNSEGRCTLYLARGANVVLQAEAGVQMVTSHYTCMGFDMDTSSIEAGDYELSVRYTGGGKEYASNQTLNLR